MAIKSISITACFFLVMAQSWAQSFVNGSFETWGQPGTCEINTAPDGWGNYSTGCIAFDEGNFLICSSTIPSGAANGNTYARACAGPDWQGGEGVFQFVNNLNPGQPYTFSFDYAGSNLYGGTDSVTWRVYIDDTLITQTPYYSSLQPNWITFTVGFTATQSTHKIGFRSYFINPCATCAGSAGIDNVHFSESPTSLLQNENDASITIYPVPTEDNLRIQNAYGDEVEVELYDLNSRKLMHQTCFDQLELNTHSLASGVYVCIVRKKGVVFYKKVISKR